MKVSILIPCYNVELYLPKCLESIINQTYSDLQIVIVDDGSKDKTYCIAQEYAFRDSRIEVYHQENQGVAATRNVLLSKIKGDFFLFVDSDDWIESNMVEFLVLRAKKEDADIVTCNSVANDSKAQNELEEYIYDKNKAIERFLYHLEFRGSLWNKLINVRLLNNNIKFNCDISYGEDALFCWELLKKVKKVVYTNCELYHYIMNPESLSHEVFGPKKFSAYIVWNNICNDTQILFPQFADIAKGHFCFSMLILFKNALDSKCPYDDTIKTLQCVVKKYRKLMVNKRCSNWKWSIYSLLVYLPYKLILKIAQ